MVVFLSLVSLPLKVYDYVVKGLIQCLSVTEGHGESPFRDDGTAQYMFFNHGISDFKSQNPGKQSNTGHHADKNAIRYDEHGNKVDMQSRVTMEYLILNRKTEGEGLTQVEFGLHGDSGSLLVDRFGQVYGLYYGNATSWVGGGSFPLICRTARTTSDLVKGIEKQIGGQVVLSLT